MNEPEARALLVGLLHTVAPEADLDTVGPDEPLEDALDLDSMDVLALVTGLHEAVGLDVPERDYPRLSTVRGFTAYVAEATS